jgi:hypothetical protein
MPPAVYFYKGIYFSYLELIERVCLSVAGGSFLKNLESRFRKISKPQESIKILSLRKKDVAKGTYGWNYEGILRNMQRLNGNYAENNFFRR